MHMMRRPSTYFILAGCAIASALLLALPQPTQAQKKVAVQFQPGDQPGIDPLNPKKEEKLGPQFSAIKLIENAEFQEYITLTSEYIRDKNWPAALAALKPILESPKDYFAEVKRTDPVSGLTWYPSGMVRVYGVLPRIYSNMIRASYVAGYPVPRRRAHTLPHAWVAFDFPGTGFVDFDPTRGELMPAHVVVGWGRGYDDVAALSGTLLGGGGFRMTSTVTVEPLE